DMIHILRGSRYDGYFEKVAERIMAVLTPETKETILKLKYQTPDTLKIMGIEYYQAVIEYKIRSYDEFIEWRNRQNNDRIIEWMP
ncbi:phosphoglycerate mutase family protein, partial [Dysgonomonas sp. Marseille-P4677]|nr:phosphoglycerate mutase family protein [Dysgonomonas sp. Marseille-P4677]